MSEPIHPGEILRREFLKPLGLTPYALSKALCVPSSRIYAIVAGERRVKADTALRLSRFFGTSARFWMDLQSRYDLETAEEKGKG